MTKMLKRTTTNKNTEKQRELKGTNKKAVCPICGEIYASKFTELFATIQGKPSYVCKMCKANIETALASGKPIFPFANTMDTNANVIPQGTPKRSNCAYQMKIHFDGIALNVADCVYLASAGYTMHNENGYYVAVSPMTYGANVLGAFLGDTFRACFIARNVKMSKARFEIKAYTHEKTIEDVCEENENRANTAEIFTEFTKEYRGNHMNKNGFEFPKVENGMQIF